MSSEFQYRNDIKQFLSFSNKKSQMNIEKEKKINKKLITLAAKHSCTNVSKPFNQKKLTNSKSSPLPKSNLVKL